MPGSAREPAEDEREELARWTCPRPLCKSEGFDKVWTHAVNVTGAIYVNVCATCAQEALAEGFAIVPLGLRVERGEGAPTEGAGAPIDA